MTDFDKKYKVTTDFPPLIELLNLHMPVLDNLHNERDAIAHVKSAWNIMSSSMKDIMVCNGYTIGITDTVGDNDRDIYEILWDEKKFWDLTSHFLWDFVEDVRYMPDKEFRQTFLTKNEGRLD